MSKERKRVKVEYDGEPERVLDELIREFFENLGFEWYGQGYSFDCEIRDISFYFPEKES